MQTSHRVRYISILFSLILWTHSNTTWAQPISVRVAIGAVDLPLYDWSRFLGNQSNASYSKTNPNLYYSLSAHYMLSSDHSIDIGTELIRTSASDTDPLITVNWKFQGIPITLGYEYSAFRFNDHFTAIIGTGISYFISQVEAHDNLFNHTAKRYGDGYGIHASLGLNAELTQNISMISQLRFRYSDGMAFTDSKGAIKVEFTGFDFSEGLSLSL